MYSRKENVHVIIPISIKFPKEQKVFILALLTLLDYWFLIIDKNG